MRTIGLLLLVLLAAAQAGAQSPASPAQFAEWQRQIRAALFLAGPAPVLAPREFSRFTPMPGVEARRITYGTQYGMRVPAIVYSPAHPHGKLPAIVIVAGHGGDKTSWYEVYAGLLYASAGAVVVTYDPIGEDERQRLRQTDARAHDTVLPGAESPARMGGLMVGDVLQAVSYAASLPEVDPRRIAVLGYSMGSLHAAMAAAIDPRIRLLVLSGGGDLDGNGGSWDSSSKLMCQAGPYGALDALPDKGAILYALHQRRGETLVLNGREDALVATPQHFEGFFADLAARAAALDGPGARPIEYRFYPGVGHRPSWVNRDAAEWLNQRLRFPRWRNENLASLGETRIGDWPGGHINRGYDTETREGGVKAVGEGFPAPAREALQVVPEQEWLAHPELYLWESWARQTMAAQGIQGDIPGAAAAR